MAGIKVLVAYASRYGATQGIAARIAGELRSRGLGVDLAPVDRMPDVTVYDAAVVGSAVYFGSWLPAGRRFVYHHAEQLKARPLWLFSSGPVAGQPDTPPRELVEFDGITKPLDHAVFEGALLMRNLNFPERAVVRMVKGSYGDHRDWPAIDQWAARIATQLPSLSPAR